MNRKLRRILQIKIGGQDELYQGRGRSAEGIDSDDSAVCRRKSDLYPQRSKKALGKRNKDPIHSFGAKPGDLGGVSDRYAGFCTYAAAFDFGEVRSADHPPDEGVGTGTWNVTFRRSGYTVAAGAAGRNRNFVTAADFASMQTAAGSTSG